MSAACWLASAVFCVFAILQWNDLEQYGTRLWAGWLLFYAAVAAVSGLAARRPLPRRLTAAGAVLALAAAALRARAIEWQGPVLWDPANAAGNETGGLLIVAGWLAVLAWKRHAAAS